MFLLINQAMLLTWKGKSEIENTFKKILPSCTLNSLDCLLLLLILFESLLAFQTKLAAYLCLVGTPRNVSNQALCMKSMPTWKDIERSHCPYWHITPRIPIIITHRQNYPPTYLIYIYRGLDSEYRKYIKQEYCVVITQPE